MSEDRDAMTLEKARSIAQAVSHRRDGTSQAFAVLDAELERLTTNESAMKVWMNGIDEILGCEFEREEKSPFGNTGLKCRVCLSRSPVAVRGSAMPCKEKVRSARAAGVVRGLA